MVDPVTLLALVAATFGIGVVGSLAGLVLGNLRLPLLLLALPPAVSGGTNIVISGAGAAAGVLTHARSGYFDRGAFWIMAPPSVAGALIGGFVAGSVPGTFLILFVTVIVIEQGIELVRASRRKPANAIPVPVPERKRRRKWWLGGAGLAIGLLGGIVGLILGTIRLPVLLRAGVGVRDAVSTNLGVGVVVGVAGFVGHLATGGVSLLLVGLLVPAAMVGGVLGARIAGAFSERNLKLAIGWVLIGVGALLLLSLAWGFRFA